MSVYYFYIIFKIILKCDSIFREELNNQENNQMKYLYIRTKNVETISCENTCIDLNIELNVKHERTLKSVFQKFKRNFNENRIYRNDEIQELNTYFHLTFTPSSDETLTIYTSYICNKRFDLSEINKATFMGDFSILHSDDKYYVNIYIMLLNWKEFTPRPFIKIKYELHAKTGNSNPHKFDHMKYNTYNYFLKTHPLVSWPSNLKIEVTYKGLEYICIFEIIECLYYISYAKNITFEGQNMIENSNKLKSLKLHSYITDQGDDYHAFIRYQNDAYLDDINNMSMFLLDNSNYNYCQELTCLNGGTCVLQNSDALCTCLNGYYGSKCEYEKLCGYCEARKCNEDRCSDCETGLSGNQCHIKICNDELSKKMCFGHGVCAKNKDTRTCDCNPGWNNTYCDTATCKNYHYCDSKGICEIKNNSHICDCYPGWGGEFCNDLSCQKIKYCDVHGRCNDSGSVIKCDCQSGWSGLRCKQPTCKDNKCNENQNCIIRNYLATCVCKAGRSGTNCLEESCVGYSECSKNSECQIINGTRSCICLKGWAGNICNESVCDDTKICGSHGKCHKSTDNIYSKCECDIGWKGDYCDIIDCIANVSCNNKGTCRIKDLKRKCECFSGWKGENCEISICENNDICGNHGICYIDGTKESCRCIDGYKGDKCDEINCKDHSTCGYHGTCYNTNNTIICDCDPGYDGETCEEISCLNWKRCLPDEDCKVIYGDRICFMKNWNKRLKYDKLRTKNLFKENSFIIVGLIFGFVIIITIVLIVYGNQKFNKY